MTITSIIDGVSDGTCSANAANGHPKMVELYVDGTVDFSVGSGYNLEVETNGSGGGAETWNLKPLSSLGTITDSFVYIINNATSKTVFETMYPAGASLPQVNDAGIFLNGNDSIRITDENGTVLDQLGNPADIDGTAGDYSADWAYADSYLRRNDGILPNGGTFNVANWTVGSAWGTVSCAEMATDVGFGSYSVTALSVTTQNITIQLDTDGLATITTTQIDNGSTGAGGIASYSLDVTNFTCTDIGSNTVNLTVTDNKGGSASAPATVLVEDSIVPTVLTQNITVQLDTDGLATLTTTQIDNGSTDNCSIASYSLDITSFTCTNIGPNTVILTVNDANGNSNSETATVTIADSEVPTVLTQNITVELDANGLATITTTQIDNSSTDNCSIATSSLDVTNFTCANIGPNTVNLTINDVNGNSNSASAIVTIVDAVAPNVVTQNITVQLDGAGNATITAAEIENGTTDSCGIASSSLDTTSFTIADLGPNTVNLTVTDVNGNSASAPATVTVVDTVVPIVITQDITVQLNSDGLATITPAQIDNGSTAEVPISSYTLDNTNFTCEDIGLNTVNLTVTDINDISATASATVTVEDNIAPTVITNNITVQLNNDGLATITPAQIDNSSTDNCAIATYSLNITEFDCSSIGENIVSLTVTDVNNNNASESATITVEDITAPTVQTQDITIQLDSNGLATITTNQIDNSSIDNCAIANYSLNITEFNCESIGENTVSLTVTDVNDNSASATATVTVEDTTAPTVNTQNITVQLDSEGTANITSEMIDAISTDNCEIDNYEIDITNFTCDNIGENTVTLTVTDIYENSSTASAIVTVEDTIAPNVVTVEPFTLQLDEFGSTITISVEDIENGSTDACGIDSYSLDVYDFDCTNVGENIVTLSVTDINGNTGTATTIVTIEDISTATIITQDITITLNSRGEASITTDLIDNGSFDNCGIASISLDKTNFDCATIGEHIVTLTILDNSDNSSSETAIVTVTSFDIDGDLIADNCDDDMDGDGILNEVDNCETTYNPDQKDVDFNGIGDACDEAPTVAAQGFSPNGDGIGDTFIIEGLHRFPDNTLEIYNRWGSKVFSQNSYQNDWNGIANGKGVLRKNQKLPAGPYFYVLIAKQDQIYKGWMYINY